MPRYLRLSVDAASARMHNTIPLRRAFGLPEHTQGTIEELSRVSPSRVVQPVEVTWTGKQSDVIEATVGFRQDDLLVSDALYARLAGARLAPHFLVSARCVKSTKWGLRAVGEPADYRWIGWTERSAIAERIDWPRSTFLVKEQNHPAGAGWQEGARRLVRLDDAQAFELERNAAYARDARIWVRELEWLDAASDEADLFLLPMTGDVYVSEPLASALAGPPKLRGFRLIAEGC